MYGEELLIAIVGLYLEKPQDEKVIASVQFIKNSLAAIPADRFENDPEFKFSLRYALILSIRPEGLPVPRYELIVSQLENILPEGVAISLTLHALEAYEQDMLKGIRFCCPTQEIITAHCVSRQALFARYRADDLFHSAYGRFAPTSAGTFTQLVPCPTCELKKRCDKNTKRFKCKCGFDKPYPFSS